MSVLETYRKQAKQLLDQRDHRPILFHSWTRRRARYAVVIAAEAAWKR
jgi:hypothetical protein